MDIQGGKNSNTVPLGMLLLVLGAIALLGQTGIFRGIGNLFGALLFAGAGLYLVRRHYRSRNELWALLTGYGLFGLAGATILGPLSGTAFLGLSGLGFLIAYSEDRERWWALIPAGVLFTLALVAGIDRLVPPLSGGPVLFIGLAAIFWYLNRHPRHAKQWAIYPAVAATVLALLILFSGSGWLVSVALIVTGFFLLYRRNGRSLPGQSTLARPSAAAEQGTAAAEPGPAPRDGSGNVRPGGSTAVDGRMTDVADHLERWTAAAERGLRDLGSQLGQYLGGRGANSSRASADASDSEAASVSTENAPYTAEAGTGTAETGHGSAVAEPDRGVAADQPVETDPEPAGTGEDQNTTTARATENDPDVPQV